MPPINGPANIPAIKREGVKHGNVRTETLDRWKWKRRRPIEILAADRRVSQSWRPDGATLEPLRRTAGTSSRSGKNASGGIPLGDRRMAAFEADAAGRVEQGWRVIVWSSNRERVALRPPFF